MHASQTDAWAALWAANRAAEAAWEEYDRALQRARAAEDAYWVARQAVEAAGPIGAAARRTA